MNFVILYLAQYPPPRQPWWHSVHLLLCLSSHQLRLHWFLQSIGGNTHRSKHTSATSDSHMIQLLKKCNLQWLKLFIWVMNLTFRTATPPRASPTAPVAFLCHNQKCFAQFTDLIYNAIPIQLIRTRKLTYITSHSTSEAAHKPALTAPQWTSCLQLHPE
jgi:hypothetical protein